MLLRVLRTLGYGQTYYQYNNGDDFNDTLEGPYGPINDEVFQILENLVVELADKIGVSDTAGY